MLIIMSGLPGVGKSAVADALGRRLGAVVVSVDPIETAIVRAGIPQSFETGVAAYEVGAAVALHQLHLGLTVVADAVNSLEVGRDVWRAAARAAGAEVRVIHIGSSDADLHRRRLEHRRRDLIGFPEPTWDEVCVRQAEFEAWPEPALELDMVNELDDNVEAAAAFVLTRLTT